MAGKGSITWNRFWGPGEVLKVSGTLCLVTFWNAEMWLPIKYCPEYEMVKGPDGIVTVLPAGAQGEWMSTEAASIMLGLERLEVTIMCQRGKIEARKEGRHWSVARSAVMQRLGGKDA